MYVIAVEQGKQSREASPDGASQGPLPLDPDSPSTVAPGKQSREASPDGGSQGLSPLEPDSASAVSPGKWSREASPDGGSRPQLRTMLRRSVR